jgi:glycosyltransferase involved in cell wall biosynthesis
VLYVSKASRVATHRDKLAALAGRVDLTLVVPDRWGGVPWENGDAPAYRVVRLPGVLHGHNHLHLYRALGTVLEPGRFDLVHVDEEPYSLVTAQVVRRASALGVPALFFAWQNLVKRLPPPFGRVRRYVFRRAAGGVAGTHGAAEVLRRGGFTGRLAVIPQMGVDPERFRPDPVARARSRARIGVTGADFVVGFVGRLVPEKGVHTLIEAAGRLPRSRLLLVGDGPEREALAHRAAERGLAERVSFVGEVPSPDVPGWMVAMDCLVLPSRTAPRWKEQFGRALVEAMACAVPVVGTDSGEIPRVIGEAGTVVPEGDGAELARAIGALEAAPEVRAELGRRGRVRVLRSFTQDRVADATVAFYRTLLGKGHALRARLGSAGGPS